MSTDRDNVVVDTVKLAEDGDEVIVRAYEAYDQRGDVSLQFGPPVVRAFDCNLLEEDREPIGRRATTAPPSTSLRTRSGP